MEAFLALVVQYPEVRDGKLKILDKSQQIEHQVRDIIRDRVIVFGKDSGVSVTGQISLYSGEVRNNWLHVIKTTPEYDTQLKSLPMWER